MSEETTDETEELPRALDGTELDPVDQMPIFGEVDGEPMSRRRWLEATRPEREAAQAEQMEELVERHTVRRSGDDSEPAKPSRGSSRKTTTKEK